MEESDRRARALLALGAALGIALAGVGIVGSGRAPEPRLDGAVAVVNEQPISRESFARFAAAVAAERKQLELDAKMQRHLLSRMIDEELLFQRGLALGLARHEPAARRAIVAAMIASLGAEAEPEEPDAEALARFYESHRERFARTDRLELETAFVALAGRADGAALERARQIAERARAGEPLARLAGELGDPPLAPLPGGALSFETLRQYLGPTVAQAAQRLEPGQVGQPVRGGDGYHVLRLHRRVAGEVPPLARVREEVRSEYLRQQGDEALRRYLDELRDDGEVRILDPELQ